MDITKIKEIVNGNYSNEQKRMQILHTIANDKNAIPIVMDLLSIERDENSEAMKDINLELSRAHIFIDEYIPDNPKLRKGEKVEQVSKSFILDKIAEFYIKYKGKITHCFNRFN